MTLFIQVISQFWATILDIYIKVSNFLMKIKYLIKVKSIHMLNFCEHNYQLSNKLF